MRFAIPVLVCHLAKLMSVCLEAGEQRARLQTAAAVDSRSAAEHHDAETADLRRQLVCAHDDAASLRQQVVDAGDRQAALVVELRRTTQQVSSSHAELEASRAVATAQRETILVREAEIARLEARVGLLERSVRQSAGSTINGPGRSVPLGDERHDAGLNMSIEHSLLQLSGSSTSGGPPVPLLPEKVTSKPHDVGSTVTHDADGAISENPDSLLAIWHQLQLTDDASGDSSKTAAVTRSCGTAAPCTRLGSALEEKARVQSRIKALIGYRKPPTTTRRSAAAPSKPRMSVRPQPLTHSRSTTASTSLKQYQQQRRPSANGDSVNTSQMSTAVSHYASSSAIN